MDFITHSLVGAGIARLTAPRRDLIQQLSLAGLLGSLLMDGDSWLYLLGPNFYGKYHRVVSHSILGLTVIALAAAAIPFLVFRMKTAWRRFGWFVSDNLPPTTDPPAHPPFWLFAVVAVGAAYSHFAADAITAFGNMKPFWPWRDHDISIGAVNSFDWVIFCLTLGCHVVLRQMTHKKSELLTSAAWLALIVTYVFSRGIWGPPAFI